jgi:hypothetical protein
MINIPGEHAIILSLYGHTKILESSLAVLTDNLESKELNVGFEVLTVMSTKMAILWVVAFYTALQPRRQPSLYSSL